MKTITDLKLGESNIRLIYESTDQVLWVGTEQGLFRLDGGNWQREFDGQAINTIGQTEQGILWVGTSRGLYQFQNGEWMSELDVAVNSFIELADGTLLVGGNDGLRVKPPADETVVMRTLLPGKLIGGLFLASDGTLWCRSMAGIFSYNGLEWTNHGQKKAESQRITHSFYKYTKIYEDKSGTIWFSDDSGLLSYRRNTLEFHPLDSWTWDFVEPENGDIWALGQVGPHIYDGQDWAFLPGFNRSDSDTRNYAAYQDADGSIWVIGDSQSGVWLYDNGKWIEGLDSESKPLEGGKVSV